jgi:Glyoxalase/Bleomycin resistance protein/Dioxygenase superfamily
VLGLDFHHLGLAISGPEAAQRFLSALGYQIGPTIYDPLQGVNLAMCHHISMPDIELIWANKDHPSPIGNMLEKRDGLIYHMCYSTNNIEKTLADLADIGLRAFPLGEPKPAVLFDGLLVSFYNVRHVGLIEIIHNNSSSEQRP